MTEAYARLTGKRTLVTGGARGIGGVAAERLARGRGVRLVLQGTEPLPPESAWADLLAYMMFQHLEPQLVGLRSQQQGAGQGQGEGQKSLFYRCHVIL